MEKMPVTGPRGIVIHHSAGNDGPGINVDEIRRIHVQEKGWDDIGYHFLVEKVNDSYVVTPGRSLLYEGAHCPGKNDHIGVCVVGNFHSTQPEGGKMDKLFNLIKGLMFIYGFTPEKLFKHSDARATECPGNCFPWSQLKERVGWFYKNCRGYL